MSLSKIISGYSNASSRTTVCVCQYDSPVGKITALADDDFLYLISFEDSKNFEKMLQNVAKELSCEFVEGKNEILQKLGNELDEYFTGKLRKFTVPIKTLGSDFQKEVWKNLQKLPYASTQTYSDLAKAMGRESSHSRAIGAACGANAHILVIPCHRLVASGSKGGFSCGVDRKEWLINHEKQNA